MPHDSDSKGFVHPSTSNQNRAELLQHAVLGGAVWLALAGWQMLAGFLLLLPCHWLSGEPGIIQVNPLLVFALAYSGLMCGSVAWMLWNFMVKRLPLAAAGMVTLMIPALGVAAAWAVLGEHPSWNVSLGLLLVVVAFLVSLPKARTAVVAPTSELAVAD